LAKNFIWNVVRQLRTKVHAHASGPDEPHDLLNALSQRRRGINEQQVSFIEKENQLRPLQVTHFWK
jgi:hypothetical protein